MMLVFLIPVHLMVIILDINAAKYLSRVAIFLNRQVKLMLSLTVSQDTVDHAIVRVKSFLASFEF